MSTRQEKESILRDLIQGRKKLHEVAGPQFLLIETIQIEGEPANHHFDKDGNLLDMDEIEQRLKKVRKNGGVGLLETRRYSSWSKWINDNQTVNQ